MKVKKYIASSMPEAMKQIRAELGSEAVILNTKAIQTGGVLGLFKKRGIEVLAACDPQPINQQKPVTKTKTPIPNKLASDLDKMVPFSAVKQKAAETAESSSQKPSEELINEIKNLKMMMTQMSGSKRRKGIPYPDPLKEAELLLEKQEVDEEIREELLKTLLKKWYASDADAETSEVMSWLKKEMIERINRNPLGGISFSKKYINVAGPTGVGKTTTLAKIAAECVIKHKKRVAFITTDTYRIAAIDQLKTYAKILNVPLEVCYTIEDFKKSAEKLSDYDLILIDTAGRNFRNLQFVEDLKKVIDFDNDMDTYLVLSLTAKQRDMEDIFLQFSILKIDKLIFTKADETSSYGAMFNMVDKYKKGVAYITNGQNVPDDIIAAKADVIVKTIIGVGSNE